MALLSPPIICDIAICVPLTSFPSILLICKSWSSAINASNDLWRSLLHRESLVFGAGTEQAFVDTLRRRPLAGMSSKSSPYKALFKSRYLTRLRWTTNLNPKRLTFPAFHRSVVTSLLLSGDRIIGASDNHTIRVYSLRDGTPLLFMDGHEGGIWCIEEWQDVLVSGSADRTLRVWDLQTGLCTHVFGGHTSTVRALSIVKPELIDVRDESGALTQELWPKQPLIVTGSRDHTLRVWTLPRSDDQEYKSSPEALKDAEDDTGKNPYHRFCLEGHEHAVRALAAQGRTLVSGSYDSTVRVWDIIDGTCRFVLIGHTQKVYSVVLDTQRNQCMSGSMDSTVRIWSLATGDCIHVLTGHTSLVGLLSLSPTHLVSAAADSTLRIWDPKSGEIRHTLRAHTGAITCFQHDHFKVLSGSDGALKLWDIENGTVVRDMMTGLIGVWQVACDGQWCVAASNRSDATVIDVFDMALEGEDWTGESQVRHW